MNDIPKPGPKPSSPNLPPRPEGPTSYPPHNNPFKVGEQAKKDAAEKQVTEAFARDMLGHSIMSLDQELRVTALGLACKSNPPMDLSAEATTMIIYRAESFYHYLETGRVHE